MKNIISNICYYFLWFKRFFFSRRQFIRFTPFISLLSLGLASGSLILALSVYSGYESTMRQAVVDMTGHLTISYHPSRAGGRGRFSPRSLKQSAPLTAEGPLLKQLAFIKPNITAYAPFISLKALSARKGRLRGVLVEGLSPNKTHQTLNIKKRLIQGSMTLQNPSYAVIGRGLAQKQQLKPGDDFYLVIPKAASPGVSHNQKLYVEGVIDLGFHDLNSRLVLAPIETVRTLMPQADQVSRGVSGLRLLLKDPSQALKIRVDLIKALGSSYQVDDWQSIVANVHETYLQTIRREKFLIFFILMVLVLAAAFNVSSHLSISVLNQIREISILKVMGAGRGFIFCLFLLQGFFISCVGSLLGAGGGWLLAKGFVGLQRLWPIIPADVYKINTIITDVRLGDVVLVLVCSQAVCGLACFWPAWRALKMPVTEGLVCE